MRKDWTRKIIDNKLKYSILVGLGVSYAWYVSRNFKLSTQSSRPLDPLHVTVYKSLPLRSFSRWWGKINRYEIQTQWIRNFVLNSYITLFKCKLNEAVFESVDQYVNLHELFVRRLKDECRPINKEEHVILTAPCDGTVLQFGSLDELSTVIKGVKGADFTLSSLHGDDMFEKDSKNVVKYCVIYLAPGDYHGFHSPVNAWNIQKRCHVSGHMLSVGPPCLRRVQRVLELNERVTYFGKVDESSVIRRLALTAIGATNVGCIKVPEDEQLNTNNLNTNELEVKNLVKFEKSWILEGGQYLGHFCLGSCIVLSFNSENGKDSHDFCVLPNQKVQMGEALFVKKKK